MEVVNLEEDSYGSKREQQDVEWTSPEPNVPLQRKVSTAVSLTKAMIYGTHPLKQPADSAASIHRFSQHDGVDGAGKTYLDSLLKPGQKKEDSSFKELSGLDLYFFMLPKWATGKANVRASMGFWKLIWFDFKHWYRRWKVKNKEFILFKGYIKTMESNFGSAIGSLFVFTRSLLVLNIFLAVMWLGFVILPVAIFFDYSSLKGPFAFKNLIDGKGLIAQLWAFYGSYKGVMGGYHVGLAYLGMMIITYFGSLFIILGSIITRTDKKSASTVSAHYKFSLMLWTSWDHSITSNEAAVNLSKGISSVLKDNLYEAKASKDVQQRSRKETCKVYSRRALAWLITLILIGGGCTAIVYLVIFMSFDSVLPNEGTGDTQDFLSVYGTTVTFSLINAIVPSCIHLLPKMEQYASGRDELNVTLIRVFFLRMANLFALISSLYNTVTTSSEGCAGTVIGQELYKLVVLDTLLHTFMQLTMKFLKYFWTMKKSEFNIPTAILVLIYRQALIWMFISGLVFTNPSMYLNSEVGTLSCPVMPLVGMFSVLAFFCVNYLIISRTCKPPIKRWNQSRNTTFFTMFLLASLAMIIPPASVIIGSSEFVNLGQTENPNKFCGPFGQEKPTRAYTKFHMVQPKWLHGLLEYLVSEPVVLPLFLILFSVMVHQRSKIGNQKRHSMMLQAELYQEREDNERMLKKLQSMGIGVERQ